MSVTIDSVKIYINQFIQNFHYTDAIFLAERLYAEGSRSIDVRLAVFSIYFSLFV